MKKVLVAGVFMITNLLTVALYAEDKIDTLRGMDICITTTAKNNEEGLALLQQFKFPFKS